MKTLLAVLFSIGLTFTISCGNEQVENPVTVQEVGSHSIAPSAPPFHHPSRGISEEIFVPVQRIVPKVGSTETILADGSPPELYIAAFQIRYPEPNPREAVRIHVYVGRERNGFVYANYPVRVSWHPSINVYLRPEKGVPHQGVYVFRTDDDGQMIFEARSKTGKSQPIYFDVGATKYKVFLGDS